MSGARGLTAAEARRRLRTAGPNEIAARPAASGVRQVVTVLGNPLVLVLLGAAAVAAVLGEAVNASLIVLMVALSVGLNVAQTSRSQRAAERPREVVTPTATVVRDGVAREVPRREVVPGDRIMLGAGDRIPADARLVDAHDLHVQQAALTGESMPAEKHANADGDVESLATQTLVLFVIRTAGSPFRSRPSPALAATTLAVVAVAIALPFTPLAPVLGFVPLPALFFVFLAVVVLAYLLLVEVVKRSVMRGMARTHEASQPRSS